MTSEEEPSGKRLAKGSFPQFVFLGSPIPGSPAHSQGKSQSVLCAPNPSLLMSYLGKVNMQTLSRYKPQAHKGRQTLAPPSLLLLGVEPGLTSDGFPSK